MINVLCKYNGLNVSWSVFLKRFLALVLLCLGVATAAEERVDVAMVTALQGSVSLLTPQGLKALQPFSRLKKGDLLSVDNSTLIKLIFFSSGRQEIWQGKGRIEILDAESKASGLSGPDAKIFPGFMVRQIAKTPSGTVYPLSSTTSGRSRSIGGGGSVERIEASYRRMRMEAAQGDLNPELFLLSALFEIREIDRVEQVMAELKALRPADPEARMVIALYQKAVRNLKEGGGKY